MLLIGAPAMLLIHLHLFGSIYAAFVPAQTVELKVPQVNATLRLNLWGSSPIGKAEFDRQMVVTAATESKTLSLFTDWGGADRISMYLTETNDIVLLGPADSHRIALKPIRFGVPSQQNSEQWTYLGAFARGSEQRFMIRYYAPNDQAECIPTLTGEGRATGPRAHAYRPRCR